MPRITTITNILQELKRYDVAEGDDGDGYVYEDVRAKKDGAWIKASDVDNLIMALKNINLDGEITIE